MEFHAQLILLYLSPVFFAFIAVEWYVIAKQRCYSQSASYSWTDTVSNGILAGFHEIGDAAAAIFVVVIYDTLFEFRLFDIPSTVLTFSLLFVLQDFLYYWFHRASHNIRWMWCSHVVHHSSETLNFSTAMRQSLTYPISGMWVFWLPLVIIGFQPKMVVAIVLVNLAVQFFIHTQVVRKLGWLEVFFNTPSHHRVHHAKNPEYLEHNFGGTLIIWDKIFGTFVPERDDVECVYGIPRQIDTHNPLTLTFHEWRDMFRDTFGPKKSLRNRIRHVFGHPEWQPASDDDTRVEAADGRDS
ncbi:MAG: sterol desaturase family protein [Planctomycetales bacterium]|nr:sterol desaturase family protein [Planctomycetales bacterium]